MAETEQTLTPKQIAALGALLAGKNRTEAAKEVGVARSTITLWLQDPAFKQALAEGQAALLDELNRRLLAAGGDAVSYLGKVLKKPDSQQLGVKAADVTLRRLLQTRELTEIEQRLVALERGLAKDENKPEAP